MFTHSFSELSSLFTSLPFHGAQKSEDSSFSIASQRFECNQIEGKFRIQVPSSAHEKLKKGIAIYAEGANGPLSQKVTLYFDSESSTERQRIEFNKASLRNFMEMRPFDFFKFCNMSDLEKSIAFIAKVQEYAQIAKLQTEANKRKAKRDALRAERDLSEIAQLNAFNNPTHPSLSKRIKNIAKSALGSTPLTLASMGALAYVAPITIFPSLGLITVKALEKLGLDFSHFDEEEDKTPIKSTFSTSPPLKIEKPEETTKDPSKSLIERRVHFKERAPSPTPSFYSVEDSDLEESDDEYFDADDLSVDIDLPLVESAVIGKFN